MNWSGGGGRHNYNRHACHCHSHDVPRVQGHNNCSSQSCRLNRKLSLFGSVLGDNFTMESDVDVLVEFEQGKTPGLAIITMSDELSSIIKRQIDLRTSADLSRYFREQVLAEAMVIYEQN